MSLAPRPGILEIAPYAGGEARVAGRNRAIRLASNENPLGPSARAKAAYLGLKGELHRYPDGDATALRQAIADAEDIDAARIVCGAGSDELIGLLTRAYAGPGDEVLYSAHGFLMYRIAAQGVGATPVAAPERDLKADVDALLAHVTPRTRLLFLANPNNPTGSYLTKSELVKLHAALLPTVLLVVDAAYTEYAEVEDYCDGMALAEEKANVVVCRTFSKMHGLAGLRLGWCYGAPAVTDVLNRLRNPFNVGEAAQVAGIAAIRDRTHRERCRKHNTRWLAWFRTEAEKLGLVAYPSIGNFVLLRFLESGGRSAAAAFAHLKSDGILVRGMAAYSLPDCLRVTIGTGPDMKAVVKSLTEFLG
ncbi:MAG: histidinol-phosphate transaminase [Kiloniellales bacterium]